MGLPITRCPHCGSTFRISERQQAVAGGLARCGACLRVFRATEHLLAPDDDLGQPGSVFIGHAPEEYAGADSPQDAKQPPRGGQQNAGDLRASASAASPLGDSPAGERQDSAAFLEPAEQIDDLGGSPGGKRQDSVALPEFEEEEQGEMLPAESRETLGEIAQPLALRTAQRRNWGSLIGQAALALLLITGLAAQYLWRHLPIYSRLETLRPGYALVCARVGCELPAYSNIDAIRSDNTALREHPDEADAYLLVTQFRNAAPFPQRFPVLALRFTSLDGRSVAMREFAPAEYLDPGLLSLELMPPDSTVQAELELLDPGPEAVGYQVSFRSP